MGKLPVLLAGKTQQLSRILGEPPARLLQHFRQEPDRILVSSGGQRGTRGGEILGRIASDRQWLGLDGGNWRGTRPLPRCLCDGDAWIKHEDGQEQGNGQRGAGAGVDLRHGVAPSLAVDTVPPCGSVFLSLGKLPWDGMGIRLRATRWRRNTSNDAMVAERGYQDLAELTGC